VKNTTALMLLHKTNPTEQHKTTDWSSLFTKQLGFLNTEWIGTFKTFVTCANSDRFQVHGMQHSVQALQKQQQELLPKKPVKSHPEEHGKSSRKRHSRACKECLGQAILHQVT
jgi:hypothetical protein